MTFEELDQWLEQSAPRQRLAIRETVASDRMAITTAAGHDRQTIAAEMLGALGAVTNPNGTWSLPGERRLGTW